MLPNVGNESNSIKENCKKQQQPRHLHQPSCTAKEKHKYESKRSTTKTNQEVNVELCSYSRSVYEAENKKTPTSDSCEKPKTTLLQNSNLEQGYQTINEYFFLYQFILICCFF